LFDWLCERDPGQYQEGQLRTLQRRVSNWRALNDKQLLTLDQVHRSGEVLQTDGTWMNDLGITIQGLPFADILIHSVLTYSNQEWGRVEVKYGVIGGAKGGKGRTVYLGKTTRKAVWCYLIDREDANDPDAPVFLDQLGRHFNRGSLRQLIKDIAERAEVKHASPHKFRHTFAITYLRSGDLFILQSLLGHSYLEMVRHYALIAEIDIARAHHKASPAVNWRL
jgi:hypothetical protein